MAELIISGHSDDCVDFEGVIRDEFYVDGNGEWSGWLESPDGDAVEVYVSFCKTNPKGWKVSLLSECPWPVREDVRYNSGYDDDEDYYLVLDVPVGTVVEQEKGGDQ